jgi:hypothetical protein
MLDPYFLTKLDRPGGQGVLHASATLEERNALALYLTAMRGAGHAVSCDEVMADGEFRGDLRIIHFLSCKNPNCVGNKQ